MAGNTDWYRTLLRGAVSAAPTSIVEAGEPPVGGVRAAAAAPAPAPDAHPAPDAQPAPQARPAPETRPAPDAQPAPKIPPTGASPAPALQPDTSSTVALPPDDGYYLSPVAGAIVVAALERRYMDGAVLIVTHRHDPEFAVAWRQVREELDARQPRIGVAALLAFRDRVEMER